MQRRGVIQSIYKEVMTPSKEEKITEENVSVEPLFDGSTNELPLDNSEAAMDEGTVDRSVLMNTEINMTK
jgi:hypothetical protein